MAVSAHAGVMSASEKPGKHVVIQQTTLSVVRWMFAAKVSLFSINCATLLDIFGDIVVSEALHKSYL